MADGKGCKCGAYDRTGCCCDADWTPQEVYDLRAKMAKLRLTDAEFDAIRWAADTLCVGWDDLKPDDKDRSREAANTLRRMVVRLS